MKVLIKSNVALLCLTAALHSPHILADSEVIKLPHSVFEDVDDKIKWMPELDDDDDGEYEYDDDVSPVPEANTYAMMLAGLGLVGFMVYRRRAP